MPTLKAYWFGAVILTVCAFAAVGIFFSRFEIRAQNPVHVRFEKAVWVEKRTVAVTNIVNVTLAQSIPLNPVETDICDTFGSQCLMALRVMHFEDGSEQCDRFNENSNSTTDYGLFQVNSSHIGQVVSGHKITLAELVTCDGNTKDAQLLESTEGWGIWSTFSLAK